MKNRKKYYSWLFIFLLVVFKAYIIFWQFRKFNLLVPPSPDLFNHLRMIDEVLAGRYIYDYPPLFHWIISIASHLTGSEPLVVLRAIAPFWLLLPIYPFYILSRSMFGWRVAFWATSVFIMVSANPLLNFGDAQYPDILAYNLIAPFYLLFLIKTVRSGNYWYFIPTVGLFLLTLIAHHFTSALMLAVTLVSLAGYAMYSYCNCRKKELKKIFIIFGLFAASAIPIYILARIFFGNFLSVVIGGLFHTRLETDAPIHKVLDLSEISYVLAPFLQFIGFAGLVWIFIKIPRMKRNVFPAILMLSWVVLFWIMSRSSFFYLPQRVLREISFPLCIASGFFAVSTVNLLEKQWHELLFFAVFSYLIVINSVQLYQKPFLLPDGFRYMSWFTAEDQQKYEYITNNLKENCVIATNQSNPILQYKLQKSGCSVTDIHNIVKNEKVDKNNIGTFIKQARVRYLFIGVMPKFTPADVYYTQFGSYEYATELLNMYPYNESDVVKEFSDGSKIIVVSRTD